MTGVDIVISHADSDGRLVSFISEGLGQLGCSVWCSGSQVGKTDETGKVLLTCKIFIPLFNDDPTHNNGLKDTIALSYVSNKAIVPIATKYFRSVNKHLDSGLKLILARINWVFFVKEEQYAETLVKLKNIIGEYLEALMLSENDEGDTSPSASQNISQRKSAQRKLNVATQTSFKDCQSEGGAQDEADDDLEDEVKVVEGSPRNDPSLYVEFWDRHFHGQAEVLYTTFRDKFVDDYGVKIARTFGEDKINLFVNLMYKDIFNLNKVIKQTMYKSFICDGSSGNPNVFFDRLYDYATSYFATREVFDMDSTVRLTAIQNLGQFNTDAVVDYLVNLTKDPEPNVRAISGLALAKTGRNNRKLEESIIHLMEDEDRLVRESACLSLAYMRCLRATPAIVNLWRNDPIKQVREAAEIALSRMGGDEAQRNIKITRVLTQEMQSLKSLPTA